LNFFTNGSGFLLMPFSTAALIDTAFIFRPGRPGQDPFFKVRVHFSSVSFAGHAHSSFVEKEVLGPLRLYF